MKSKRIAEWAAGVALFYGTLAGVCQDIAIQPETTVQPAHPTAVPIPAAGTSETGRTSIQFVATGARAGEQTPKSCQDVLAVILPSMQAYPHPASWTWYVACDEAAWSKIQSHQGNQVGSGILAITNRDARSTILRGSAMLHAYSRDYRAQPEHVIAHELCHIYLQSSDEYKVDEVATRWVEERKARHLAVLTVERLPR